ncbi:hypothetical protein [Microseira sp. BLCC-F43]|uniref:hypothetical protein n=1 Tax=Microseira sp. BLCC-F43 TaxID=3153602 RepID=UPI0035BC3D0A
MTKILKFLQNNDTKNPFSRSKDGNRLLIDIDEIAFQVASSTIQNPLGISASSAKSASVNLSRGVKPFFINQVQQIRDCLKKHLASLLTQEGQDISLEDYVNSLATELKQLTGESKTLGFTYPFGNPNEGLQKQRLSVQQNANNNCLLKFHKLTITVENTSKFDEALKASLRNFINLKFSSNQQEDFNDILDDLVKDLKSDFYIIKHLMDTEALGKLQREGRVKYLEFLLEQLDKSRDAIYLKDLIRRLKLIEEYISDVEKEDGHYEVNYAGISVNYKEIFSRADAFDMLPIIPLIVGYLGETTDEDSGKLQFIFGLKLKLGGKVQSQGGETVFDYYLNLLDSNSTEHKESISDSSFKKFLDKKY